MENYIRDGQFVFAASSEYSQFVASGRGDVVRASDYKSLAIIRGLEPPMECKYTQKDLIVTRNAKGIVRCEERVPGAIDALFSKRRVIIFYLPRKFFGLSRNALETPGQEFVYPTNVMMAIKHIIIMDALDFIKKDTYIDLIYKSPKGFLLSVLKNSNEVYIVNIAGFANTLDSLHQNSMVGVDIKTTLHSLVMDQFMGGIISVFGKTEVVSTRRHSHDIVSLAVKPKAYEERKYNLDEFLKKHSSSSPVMWLNS